MDRNLWGLDVNHKDYLVFGGCDMVELAEHYQTPLHIVDKNKLRHNYYNFIKAFTDFYPKVDVFYSYKTNCVPGILRVLHEEGCGAEVISPYELWLASKLDVDSSKIIYNGANKSIENLKMAIQKNIGFVNIDSENELHRLKSVSDEIKIDVNFGMRIYPEVGWRAHFGMEAKGHPLVYLLKKITCDALLELVLSACTYGYRNATCKILPKSHQNTLFLNVYVEGETRYRYSVFGYRWWFWHPHHQEFKSA